MMSARDPLWVELIFMPVVIALFLLSMAAAVGIPTFLGAVVGSALGGKMATTLGTLVGGCIGVGWGCAVLDRW